MCFVQAKDCSFLSKSDRHYKARFALRFLLLFAKATSLSNTLELYLAADYPLMTKYAISDIGELHLYQTAIVEEDDDAELTIPMDDDTEL